MSRPPVARFAAGLVVLGLAAAGCSGSEPDLHSHPHTAAASGPGEWLPAPVVPLDAQPPPGLVVDAPLPDPLANGLVVLRYRPVNLRIVPVFGPNALDVSPRIGHVHVVVDDAPWHWADASGEPLVVQGLPPGPHKIWIGLADPTHKIMDSRTVEFVIPPKRETR